MIRFGSAWFRGPVITATLTIGAALAPAATVPGAASDPPVKLPPLVVEARSAAPHWRYLATPTYEILAQCDDETTRAIADTQDRLHQLLAYVLPSSLQLRPVLPQIMILYDDSLLPESAQAALAILSSPPDSKTLPTLPEPASELRIEYLANPSLYDPERVAVFVRIPRAGIGGDRDADVIGRRELDSDRPDRAPADVGWTMLTPSYVAYLLNERRPPLPNWFRSGFIAMYEHATFRQADVMVAPFEWTSPSQTRALREGHEVKLALLPLREMLSEPRRADVDITLWLAEAELFVRWGSEPSQRRGFADLVDRAAEGPVDERDFRTCLGIGFGEAEMRLREFARAAARQSTVISGPPLTSPGRTRPRNATRAEIAALKGDAERLEASYVRARQPEFAERYVNEVRRTLHRAYDRGDRTPALLAVMALCELEAGSPEKAQPLLAAAVAAGSNRPRVLFELARLTVDETRQHLPEGKPLPAAERERALRWLRSAVVPLPPIPEAYALLAVLLREQNGALDPADARLLQTAAARFPDQFELAYQCAVTLSQRGESAAAHAIVEAALRREPPAEIAGRLRAL